MNNPLQFEAFGAGYASGMLGETRSLAIVSPRSTGKTKEEK
jgi:hypothetical protein